jgi:hypothetical protein
VALARSLFRKGADFTAAMAFEMASTNLVLELGIIMLAFLGWQLTLAELVGAPIMVGLLGLGGEATDPLEIGVKSLYFLFNRACTRVAGCDMSTGSQRAKQLMQCRRENSPVAWVLSGTVTRR